MCQDDMEAGGAGNSPRACDRCNLPKQRVGFRDGLCSECWKEVNGRASHDQLLDALHLAMGAPMQAERRQKIRDTLAIPAA